MRRAAAKMLVRKRRGRSALRAVLLDGAASAPMQVIDADYFARLRERVNGALKEASGKK